MGTALNDTALMRVGLLGGIMDVTVNGKNLSSRGSHEKTYKLLKSLLLVEHRLGISMTDVRKSLLLPKILSPFNQLRYQNTRKSRVSVGPITNARPVDLEQLIVVVTTTLWMPSVSRILGSGQKVA